MTDTHGPAGLSERPGAPADAALPVVRPGHQGPAAPASYPGAPYPGQPGPGYAGPGYPGAGYPVGQEHGGSAGSGYSGSAGSGYGGSAGSPYAGSGYGGGGYGGAEYTGPGYGDVVYRGSGYGADPAYPAEPGYPGGYAPGSSGYGPAGYGGGYGGGYGSYGGGYGGYPPGGPGYGGPGGIIGGPGPEQPRRRGSRIITYIVVAALAAGIGAGAVLAVNGSSPSSLSGPGSGGLPQGGGAPGGTNTSSSTVQSVDNAVSPGIVDVISSPSYEPGTLEGTGMVIRSDGLVLTNNHVIEGTGRIEAKIADTGQKFTATVLGTDAAKDIALLKLDNASNLKTVPLGNSDTVQVGQSVVALGNAEGQDGRPTVVAGTITSLRQSIQASNDGTDTQESLHGMLETNAPIVPGDSGGALADTSGRVIGMNTAASGTSSGQGTDMGYAIPINTALSIAERIASGQASSDIQIGLPAFLGVTVASSRPSGAPSASPSPQRQLRQLEQPGGFGGGFGGGQGGTGSGCLNSSDQQSVPQRIPNVSAGTLVGGVLCGTPASSAGMSAGSVITRIDGASVSSPATLTKVLTRYRPGATVTVSWVAVSGQRRTAAVKLVAGPAK